MTYDNDKLSGIRDRISLTDGSWSNRRRSAGWWVGLAVILGLAVVFGERVVSWL